MSDKKKDKRQKYEAVLYTSVALRETRRFNARQMAPLTPQQWPLKKGVELKISHTREKWP